MPLINYLSQEKLTWLIRCILILIPKLKFVNFDSQTGLNFNRFSLNFQNEKNAILTGNFYLIRICSLFLQILQYWWYSKTEILRFLTVKELFLYVKY